MVPALYIDFTTIQENTTYTVIPLQKIVFVSADFSQCSLQRDGTTLTFLLQVNSIVLLCHDFFIGETLGFFPTIVLPNQEHISGFGFLALLAPSILGENMLYKGGSYGMPEGSIIDILAQKYTYEEALEWNIPEELRTAPQKNIKDNVKMFPVEDESPEFYNAIDEYIQSTSQEAFLEEEEEAFEIEENAMQSHENMQEEQEESVEHEEYADEEGYFTAYVLSQQNIDDGYVIVGINGDPATLEQMTPAQYGYITMTSYGWFSYILGEGIAPEEGGYLEDYFPYSISTDEGERIEGGVTIQSYYQEGTLVYQEYHTEI